MVTTEKAAVARAGGKHIATPERVFSLDGKVWTETEFEELDRGELEGILAENGVKPRGNTRHTATWRTALRKASCTVKAGGESAPEPEREPEEWAEVEVFSVGGRAWTRREMEGLEREALEGILSENGIIARGNTTHAATLRTALRKACTVGRRGDGDATVSTRVKRGRHWPWQRRSG